MLCISAKTNTSIPTSEIKEIFVSSMIESGEKVESCEPLHVGLYQGCLSSLWEVTQLGNPGSYEFFLIWKLYMLCKTT